MNPELANLASIASQLVPVILCSAFLAEVIGGPPHLPDISMGAGDLNLDPQWQVLLSTELSPQH